MSAPGAAAGLSEFPVAFGRYLLLKRLSRGGMGEIFLAKIGELKGFEKFVIIKKILPQLAENEDFIARFIDEVQIAIKLNHVNIANVFEAGTVDKEYFLAIEYIEGRDLRRFIRRIRELGRRLSVDQCLYIARDLAAGLAYAHRRTGTKGQALSLVHCDISPPNIMCSYEGEVKIIDFGIARSALRTADSNPNVGFGKFGYMAPEQLIRGGVIDRRTDIYAAGVVLYELLTGERLYQFPEGTDYRQMARMVCQGKFTPPAQRDSRIDSVLDAIVCKAIATRPEDRYQFAEEFRDALQQKLYQMNPTISADTLARTMDELFVGERQHESEELQQMRAVDAAAYREELSEAVGHTVTFARAPEDGQLTVRSDPEEAVTTAMPHPPVHDGGPSNLVVVTPQGSSGASGRPGATLTAAVPVRDRERDETRRSVIYGLLAFMMVFGAGGIAFWARSRQQTAIVGVGSKPPSTLPPTAPPAPVPVVEALPPPTPPVVTPPPVEPPAPPAPKKLPSRPAQTKPRPVVKAEVKQEVLASDPVATEKKRIEFDRKFQQAKSEYLEFKKNFGARLEGRWQQILSDIALGRRDQGLSDSIDALRRDMKQLKSEKP